MALQDVGKHKRLPTDLAMMIPFSSVYQRMFPQHRRILKTASADVADVSPLDGVEIPFMRIETSTPLERFSTQVTSIFQLRRMHGLVRGAETAGPEPLPTGRTWERGLSGV